MPRVFLSNLDLGPVLEAVRRNGAAVVAQALGDRFRTRLARELSTVPDEPAPVEVGPVRQETDHQAGAAADRTLDFGRCVF